MLLLAYGKELAVSARVGFVLGVVGTLLAVLVWALGGMAKAMEI